MQFDLWANIAPSLFLAFGQMDDAGGHHLRLGQQFDVRARLLRHFPVGIATSPERYVVEILLKRCDSVLNRRLAIHQHYESGTIGDHFDDYLFAFFLIVGVDVGGVVQGHVHPGGIVFINVNDDFVLFVCKALIGRQSC